MIVSARYAGPFWIDSTVPGQSKADDLIPAHGNGALQVSRDRWLVLCATLDPNGWDAVHSILYQLRADRPNGPVITERLLVEAESGWEIAGSTVPLRKIFGMPMAFGVPAGAVDAAGAPLPNANVFAVTFYRRGLSEVDGRLLTRDEAAALWSGGSRTLTVEWLQLRLNDAGDDIEILQPRQVLCQTASGEHGELTGASPRNHAMTPPVAANAWGTRWCEVATFAAATQGKIAPIAYDWNPVSGLYEWTRTGPLHGEPGLTLGETSLSRWNHGWVIAARTWERGGVTAWYRPTDLFGQLGAPVFHATTWGPRHSFRCADGQLRIFHNDQTLSPHHDKRNPLYSFEVDPASLAYSEPRILFDAREHLPFDPPFCDMAKLCPAQGREQILIFRAIDATMTTDATVDDPADWQHRLANAGIHHLVLEYDNVEPSPWRFPQ